MSVTFTVFFLTKGVLLVPPVVRSLLGPSDRSRPRILEVVHRPLHSIHHREGLQDGEQVIKPLQHLAKLQDFELFSCSQLEPEGQILGDNRSGPSFKVRKLI